MYEWESLDNLLPSLKQTSNEMALNIAREGTRYNRQIQHILSDHYAVSLSTFQAPGGEIFIIASIRPYFQNEQGIHFKKKGGITLNFDELHALGRESYNITKELGCQIASTKMIQLDSDEDVQLAKELVEDFWKMGNRMCRIVLS